MKNLSLSFKRQYRIIEKECSDNKGTWIRYVPQYRYLFFPWRSWYDSFYGWEDYYQTLEEAQQFINNKLNRDSYTEKTTKIYKIISI